MTDFKDSFLGRQNTASGAASGSVSPISTNHKVPNISIRQDSGSPVNAELLSRLFDIKKQLSQSFHTGSGGVSKPHSRRNSAYYVKLEQEDTPNPEEQGNERKRRDNINDRIQELLTLVPPEYFHESAKEGSAAYDDGTATKSTGTKDGKPNKGQVLSKSVEYIQELQNLIDENNRKEVELLLKLKTLQMKQEGKTNVSIQAGTTSAELALGEIGVGPHSEEYFKKVLSEANERRG